MSDPKKPGPASPDRTGPDRIGPDRIGPPHPAPRAGGGQAMPRVLLRRLREMMADRGDPQDRLNRIVELVAATMVAEVCSLYLTVPDRYLELVATQGLKPEAVHATRLRWDEGIVGLVAQTAEPIRLTDAQSHPRYSFRPETGEELYRSFLAVPLLRGGRTLGVLTVQNRTSRRYSDEEVEALETIAMLMAELVVAADIAHSGTFDSSAIRDDLPFSVRGTPLAAGVAQGQAVLHEPSLKVLRMVSDDVEAEQARLKAALTALTAELDRMIARSRRRLSDDSRDILDAFRMYADDKGWQGRLSEAVASGLTAEAAVERVHRDLRARLPKSRDPMVLERLHDLDDLATRLLRHLSGGGTAALPGDAVIIARTITPAQLLDYGSRAVRGLLIEDGARTSHVAVVARALDIPLVACGAELIDRVNPGDMILIDGQTGDVQMRPSPDILEAFQARQDVAREQVAAYRALRVEPAITRDGVAVDLMMNAGLTADLHHMDEFGAAGIGLFRTELQFLVSSTMPRLAAQVDLYQRVLEAAGGRPVTFRTLDLGGDKVPSYGRVERDANPALGWRAIRITLDRPALLRYQLRAMIRAAEGRTLRVLFPMIAELPEFTAARDLLRAELKRADQRGTPRPVSVKVGVMLEVPALIWQLDALLEEVDFVALGTNDLCQFLFAADRTNARVAHRYDPLSPSFMALTRHVVARCSAHEVPLTVCGDMAGEPLEAMALLGLGIRSLSMPAPCLGPVKAMARALHIKALETTLEGAGPDGADCLRRRLEAFAAERSVPV